MFRPEEQQIEICLLKSNLEQIENELMVQCSALPELNEENEQKRRETMNALKVTRSCNSEIERQKLENIRLTAKRMQLKRQRDDIIKSVERARETQRELANSLKQEAQETELLVRQYEDKLHEIADRFRKTSRYYIRARLVAICSPPITWDLNITEEMCMLQNEDEINKETENVNTTIKQQQDELEKRQRMVDELKSEVNLIQPVVPEDLLTIMGKTKLDAKVKELTETLEALIEKRDFLLNKKNTSVVKK